MPIQISTAGPKNKMLQSTYNGSLGKDFNATAFGRITLILWNVKQLSAIA